MNSECLTAPEVIVPDVVGIPTEEQRARLEKIEAWLLGNPQQAEYELKHSFSPGIYFREITMLAPRGVKVEEGQVAGTLLIGHEHTGEHFNIVLSGTALVLMEGKTHLIEGPCYFKSGAGVRKVLWVIKDMCWVTVHPNPTEERDVDKLEEMLTRKSSTFMLFEIAQELEQFRAHTEQFKPSKEEFLP